MNGEQLDLVRRLAAQLRVDSIRCSTEAGSGHPTSSLSAADLIAVLLAGHLRYDWDQPRPRQQRPPDLLQGPRLAAAVLDVPGRRAWSARTSSSTPTGGSGPACRATPPPVLPWVDVATGSLGLGIAAAVGVCLAGRYLDQLDYHVWVLCGDSETAEGSVWEALDKASYYKLGNLTVIVDVNRLGQRGPTELEWDLDTYAARVEAFGCRGDRSSTATTSTAIDEALTEARSAPTGRR